MRQSMKDVSRRAVLRLVDANFNRAKEAFRVAEDILRFLENDAPMSRRLKKLRHELTKVVLNLPIKYHELLSSRDVLRDVGKSRVVHDKSIVRPGDLLAANFKRAQEALRVLEEISKLLHADTSKQFQKLRFASYELEKRACEKI